MQKTSVLVNDSCGETIASPSLSIQTANKTSVTANQNDLHYRTELIVDHNMEEKCANVSTDDAANKSKNVNDNANVNLSEKTQELNAFECVGGDEHKNMPDAAATVATPMTMQISSSSPDNSKSEPSTKTKKNNSNNNNNNNNNNSKAVVIKPPPLPPPPPPSNVETICDDISSTTEDIKRLKHVQVRSNSTGKLYQSSRRVSFPENDKELVTGYLEPADPWACVKPATCVSELAEFYRESCKRHNAQPIESIMKHLDTLDLKSNSRRPVLNLREQNLTAESCEALEEVLKRIQYKLIDLTDCGLNDASATTLFDIIEYYEAANEIDISENRNITNRGWQACINMVKRSHALQILVTRGTPLSESNAISLGKSMLTSSLNTLKLEHCGLSGRPMASLCTYLRKNTVLRELWLAHNDLTADDAYNIGNVLKSNFHLQFLDLSNNNIQDRGVLHIAEALIDQSNYFKVLHGSNPLSSQTFSAKHTLTRGDKNESKYECLARLINATKPNAEAIPKSISSESIITTESTPSIIHTTKAAAEQIKQETVEIVIAATKSCPTVVVAPVAIPATATATTTIAKEEVTKLQKNDNNNIATFQKCESVEPTTTTTTATTTTTTSEKDSQPSVCELKIVEKVEQSPNDSKNDNDDDTSSIVTSNSGNSLDSPEKNADETIEDNNNGTMDVGDGGDGGGKHTQESNELTHTEQSIDLAAQQSTIQSKEDLTDSLSDTPSAIIDDCQLDINENKSDMKLNYAEVVKVESSTLDGQLCENKNFSIGDDNSSDYIDNRKHENSENNSSSDLDDKVQIITDSSSPAESNCAVVDNNVKRNIGCSSPKPIQITNAARHDDPDEEMSPICKVRLPLNSPRLNKSKDILGELPLTPDSSHSLDSSCEYSTPFETMRVYNASSIVPERSFSSESLNSETSIESNDSKSSIKLTESKFSKNGTLERQNNACAFAAPSITTPNGLQVLMLWNNRVTRDSAQSISKLLSATTTLEILNVGKNVLSNDFVANIKTSLKTNTSLTSLGLQSVHLSNDGIKTLSEILDFGGNVTLQRIDLRDNNLQVNGLTSLNEVLKSNKSITRIDLDDVPRRVSEHSSDSSIDYNRVVNNIRSLCARNENPPDPEPIRTSVKRVRANFLNSRKISLTCQSIRNIANDSPQQVKGERLLDPARKGRLRSPSPSPIPSPASSPIPSPSRSRFQVSRVVESNVSSPITPPSSNSCSPTSNSSSSSRFRVTVVEPPKIMSAPVTIINSTNKENNDNKSIQKNETKPTIPATATAPVAAAMQTSLQRTQSAPSSTMSQHILQAPTLIEPNSTPKTDGTKDAATGKKPTEQHQQQPQIQQQQPQPHTQPHIQPQTQPLHQHIATTTLTVIDTSGNSFDSPDLEVKGYMDDSCSSFSSLDSIDRGQDFNTSFSSMESYEILRDHKFTTDTTGKHLQRPKIENVVAKDSSGSPTENVKHMKSENSASSLEASTCSNDSIYGSQEFPVLKISSNEVTLTNSPVSPCSGNISLSDKDRLSPKPDDKQQRVRKTSWISRGDAVPATLDKLLSIFHHPSNLFFPRTNNGDVTKKESQAQPQPPQSQMQENKPPSRKESPSGLFAWTRKENVFADVDSNISPENTITTDAVGIEAIPIQLKQDLENKENTSPEHTITAESIAKSSINQSPSPEHGPKVEKTSIATGSAAAAAAAVAEADKVHFEVGGDDDDDDDDDEYDGNKNEFTGKVQVNAPDESNPTQPTETQPEPTATNRSVAAVNAISASNHVGKAFGLGQITRDSLSILKGSSNNSQDSMRSLESLSEIVFEDT